MNKLKVRIKNYFNDHHGKIIDLVELYERLGEEYSLKDIVDACEQLCQEGKIKYIEEEKEQTNTAIK